ncbi:sigma-70 family RNA polymerase sigma factor [Actinokineospora enzanensis]|uniref:sigma-70 family RNA polymerase sigma factor n=1 Tax=Actinokineospora enzanensis TaxID=155975 RepID=UPI0003807680|nr:sigma-70 family RNA polymerase sigma factor [Actinokineospora enzanensis]
MTRQTRSDTARQAVTPGPGGADGTSPEPDGDRPDGAHSESWELVRAAQAGDTVAFGRLYDRYVEIVYRYVLFRVGDRELAEDVTSETFLRALRRITSVTYQGRDVGAWFVTIARNLVLDHVKSSRFRLEVTTPEIRDSERVEAGPEQQVMSKVTREALLGCVDQLGDDQRECIVLRFLQGLSVAETAEIMKRNEGAVKALQHRAVRRLAQLLPSELR